MDWTVKLVSSCILRVSEDVQELVLLLEGFHHDVDQLYVAVAHGCSHLIRRRTRRLRALRAVAGRLLLELAVVLVDPLEQIGPVACKPIRCYYACSSASTREHMQLTLGAKAWQARDRYARPGIVQRLICSQGSSHAQPESSFGRLLYRLALLLRQQGSEGLLYALILDVAPVWNEKLSAIS